MAWKAPEIEDSSTPPEYSKGIVMLVEYLTLDRLTSCLDDLPPPPRSHCSASTQTEHTECAREEFSVTVSFNSDSQSACVACGRVPAIAAVRLRCGHSLCAFHLAFFVDGYHTWMAQQASSSTAPSFPVASSGICWLICITRSISFLIITRFSAHSWSIRRSLRTTPCTSSVVNTEH